MGNPHDVTALLERELCEYTGAAHAVAVNSCTNAIQLALMYQHWIRGKAAVSIPKRTYVGVAHAVVNAGHTIKFRDEDWSGAYDLAPFEIWDCARRFTSGMYRVGKQMCVSFHISKICGVDQGGAILLDDHEAVEWMCRARFDGRTAGVHPRDDAFNQPAMHCYLSPTIAAAIRWKLSVIPVHNDDLPIDDYPDLSLGRWFSDPLRAMARARRRAKGRLGREGEAG